MASNQIEEKILAMVRLRGKTKSICPSEVARALNADQWRDQMDLVRDAAIRLEREGKIVITQKGQPVDGQQARGPVRYRIRLLLILVLQLSVITTHAFSKDHDDQADDTPAVITDAHFRIYDGQGTQTGVDQIIDHVKGVQVIFIGETHDDPVAHHLQMLLLERLASHKRDHVATGVPDANSNSLTLSLEMFERDVQLVLDEYLSGLIVEKHFLKAARTWSNYESDYRSLVEFAKQNQLPVIAANAPRRYVNLVSREGMKALDDVQDPKRSGLPPLPYAEASKAYAAKFNDLMEQFRQERAKANQATKSSQEVKVDLLPESDESDSSASAAIDDSPDAMAKRAAERSKSIQAQSLWDAAMAYSISERLTMNPNTQVLHICGSFHCENGLGIPEHLHQYRPGTSFAVINIIASDGFPHFDSESMLESGTFVLVTDNALPRSYEASAGKE